jgi:hypothetical protein
MQGTGIQGFKGTENRFEIIHHHIAVTLETLGPFIIIL